MNKANFQCFKEYCKNAFNFSALMAMNRTSLIMSDGPDVNIQDFWRWQYVIYRIDACWKYIFNFIGNASFSSWKAFTILDKKNGWNMIKEISLEKSSIQLWMICFRMLWPAEDGWGGCRIFKASPTVASRDPPPNLPGGWIYICD